MTLVSGVCVRVQGAFKVCSQDTRADEEGPSDSAALPSLQAFTHALEQRDKQCSALLLELQDLPHALPPCDAASTAQQETNGPLHADAASVAEAVAALQQLLTGSRPGTAAATSAGGDGVPDGEQQGASTTPHAGQQDRLQAMLEARHAEQARAAAEAQRAQREAEARRRAELQDLELRRLAVQVGWGVIAWRSVWM